MKGTVKWFDAAKGYGFITGEDKKDYFFHFKSLVMKGYKTVAANQEVEFETVKTDRGVAATKVVRVGEILPVTKN